MKSNIIFCICCFVLKLSSANKDGFCVRKWRNGHWENIGDCDNPDQGDILKQLSQNVAAKAKVECPNSWKSKPMKYRYIGCYSEQSPWNGVRVIATVEGKYPTVTEYYRLRKNSVEKCAKIAECLGYKMFAVQDGGWCATSADAHEVYGRYGQVTSCPVGGGAGGPGANAVYEVI